MIPLSSLSLGKAVTGFKPKVLRGKTA